MFMYISSRNHTSMGNRICQICFKPINKQKDKPLIPHKKEKWMKKYHIHCYQDLIERLKQIYPLTS